VSTMAQPDDETNQTPDKELAVVPESNDEVNPPAVPPEPASKTPRPSFWHAHISTPKRRAATIAGAVVVVGLIIGLTPLRYPVLGWGIKANLDVRVSDGATKQLLPGARVTIGSSQAVTDKAGVAHFVHINAGPATIKVTKAAYDSWTSKTTIGFGDNAGIDARLTATGIRVNLKLINYVTDQPVKGARVQVGDADVVSADDGSVAASVSPDQASGQQATAKVTADGYNDLSVTVALKDTAAISAKLVPAGSVYFLSNRSGRVDLYSAALDGSGSHVVLAHRRPVRIPHRYPVTHLGR
jgi:hypothetical protein